MKYIIATALLLFAITANAQLVRGAGVGYTNGVPSHNPGALGSPQAIDTITGYWYQYEYSTGVWRQAGFWLQPTGEAGAPSYTPIKQRQLFAINAGDSIFYYRSGQWRHLNPPPVAGTNIAVSGQTVSLDTLGLVLFKTDQTYSNGVGTLGWDNDYKTLAIGVTTDLDLRVGQNEMYHVLNDTTATLAKGKLVMATGTTGNSGKIKANYFLADGNTHGRYVLGVVAENIANGAEGYVMAFGLVRGINASGTPYNESWVNGDILYAHPDSLGGLTKVRPTSPDEEVVVAIVVSNSSTVGSIFVRPQFPFDIGELGDVKIANPTNGQVLSYNNGIWENGNAGSGVQYSDTTSLIATQYFVTSQGFLEWADTATLATQYYVDSQGFLTAEVDGSTTNELQQVDTFSIVSDSIRLSIANDGVPYTAVALGDYKQTLSVSGDSLFISNGNGVQLPPTTIDTATYLTQDTIMIYYANGIEFGRDTIRPAAGGGASLSGGVADYLVQWTGATTVDTSGVIWTGGQLGVAQPSPSATLHVTGAGSTSATSSLIVENSAGTDKLVVKDDGSIEIGRNASGTTEETASITVTGSETNIGLALVTKGNGALTLRIPDGTNNNGTARGDYAIDLQARPLGNRCATGSQSVIVGSVFSQASGSGATVINGSNNFATSTSALLLNGDNSSASINATVINGIRSSASGTLSMVTNSQNGNASLYNQRATSNGRFIAGNESTGESQTSDIRYRRVITGEVAAELFLDGSSARAILNLPSGATNGRVWNAKIQLVATVSVAGTADTIVAGSSFVGNYAVGIKRIGSNTSLIGTVQDLHTPLADTAMDDAVVSITADDTNEALKIEFTPPADAESDTVIRVVATVYLTEVGY